MIFGSGLSGMVAAYISAKALEDDAAHNESWHAQQAFRPKGQGWVSRWLPSRRGGTTTAVS
ncbi:hypothetical protein StoSoilB5_24070 [Arthrobacter sp. StoSoilB5]|nr:hypothetical protein StoSoilB5_24070 [Arthrobacter sp. StoSoilB5]